MRCTEMKRFSKRVERNIIEERGGAHVKASGVLRTFKAVGSRMGLMWTNSLGKSSYNKM